MKKGIAFAGTLAVDYIKIIDEYPKIGMLSNISSIRRCIGGCAANTPVDISKIDNTVPLNSIGIVGNDENGEYILYVLRKNKIDVTSLLTDNSLPTSFTDVMTVGDTGERTFFHARGANAMFTYEHIDFKKISADIFHIGYALLLDSMDTKDCQYGTVMARTLAEAKKMRFKTSMDVVSESGERFASIVTPSLKYTDYLIINEIEASYISGIQVRNDNKKIIQGNIRRICKKMFEKGVNDITVIHAPEAGWYMERSGKFICVPSIRLPKGFIKGSVGAGDAFCAGILYGIYKNLDPEYLLRIASAAAAASLSHENSIDGVGTLEKILELETLYGRLDDQLFKNNIKI